MKIKTILSLYRTLGHLTPIPADCGELCDAKCCQGGPEDGMLTLPGEESLLRFVPCLTLHRTAEGKKYVICSGHCIRSLRPFFCRIYPLIPIYEGEKIKVIEDPRAVYHCPLLAAPQLLDSDFRRAVCRTGHILDKDPEGRVFLKQLTAEIQEYRRFVGK